MSALERGFTLPEVMLAMSFGSLIALGAAKVLPLLHQQTIDASRHYRLALVLRQMAFIIEKDLRRSGFCTGECQGKAIVISNATGEPPGSCLIMAYDLNRNGGWETSGEAEYFGYRLRAGALESQRGVTHCQSSSWERLLDQEEVQVSSFTVRQLTGSTGNPLIQFTLSGNSTVRKNIQHQLTRVINTGVQ